MRHYRIATAGLAAAAAVTLASCSSDGDATSAPAATTNPPAAASSPATAASSPATSSPAAAGTIVEVAASNPDFSTLGSAVRAAGLADTLNSAGPYTVFAPTNQAFAALPEGVLDKLLQPANRQALTQILTHHVLPAEVMAAEVTPGRITTVAGTQLTITTDGGVRVGQAKVTATDVNASNGVIHAIDQVLVPPGVNVNSL